MNHPVFHITCKNCGREDTFRSGLKCSFCNIKNWGLDVEKTGADQSGVSLLVVQENRVRTIHSLSTGTHTIGRASGKHQPDINLDNDPYISRKQAVVTITREDEAPLVFVQDGTGKKKASSNGTRVVPSGDQVTPANLYQLYHGDRILVGQTTLTVSITQKRRKKHD